MVRYGLESPPVAARITIAKPSDNILLLKDIFRIKPARH
jgi:hypothetical protein